MPEEGSGTMGQMPDWFAKTPAMLAADAYFSLELAGSDTVLIDRYHTALDRLNGNPDDYGTDSDALNTLTPYTTTSELLHFGSDWVHFDYWATHDPTLPGGFYWPQVLSKTVVDKIREGTKAAIYKALGENAIGGLPGVDQAYEDLLWKPERQNQVERNGVRSLVTSWNCVAPLGSPFFEVFALRGPTVVEFAIGTPRPFGVSSLELLVQKAIAGSFGQDKQSAS